MLLGVVVAVLSLDGVLVVVLLLGAVAVLLASGFACESCVFFFEHWVDEDVPGAVEAEDDHVDFSQFVLVLEEL